MKKLILSALVVLGMAASSWATPFTISNSGTATNGLSVGASATFDLEGSLLKITLANTGTSVTQIGQILDGFGFSFASTTKPTLTLTSVIASGFYDSVNSTISTVSSVSGTSPYGWALVGSTFDTYFAAGNGSFKPYGILNDTSLGVTGSGGLNNAQHTPYLNTTEFDFTVTGLTSLSVFDISSERFFFGTMGDYIPGAPVPEPGTMVLLGVGMVGLALFGKRRMNRNS